MCVLQDRKAKLTTRSVDVCGRLKVFKKEMKAMWERRSQEDLKEEDSSNWDSDDKSQASQMEIMLEIVVEISCMKKIQCMANGKINAINTRTNNSKNTVVKNACTPAD